MILSTYLISSASGSMVCLLMSCRLVTFPPAVITMATRVYTWPGCSLVAMWKLKLGVVPE